MLDYPTFRRLKTLMTAAPASSENRNTTRWGDVISGFGELFLTFGPTQKGLLEALELSFEEARASYVELNEAIQRLAQDHPAKDQYVSIEDLPRTPLSEDQLITLMAAFLAEFPLLPRPRLWTSQESKLNARIREYTAFSAAAETISSHEAFMRPLQAIRDMADDARINLNQSIRSLNEKFKEEELAKARLNEATAKMDAAVLRASQELSDLADVKRAATEDIAELALQIEPLEANFENFAKAIETKYQIDVTRRLWHAQQRKNGVAFWLSAGLLVVLLIVLPGLAVANYRPILAEIGSMLALLNPASSAISTSAPIGPEIDAGSATEAANSAIAALNRLVFIAFPLALYVWLVRLVVRFNSRCLTLMDDASTRQALMDTYYRIATDNGATEKEREMMLQAMFRPLPGHQNDTADFPNVIELVQKPVSPS